MNTKHTLNDSEIKNLQKKADAVRILSADMINKAQSGHPGLPLGFADVATVLYTHFVNFDANDLWLNRDRVVLSAGHGSAMLYSILHLLGSSKLTTTELANFRQFGSLTPGHPEHKEVIGIETTTGPLGEGFANAVGFALGERILNAKFGDKLVDFNTYCIVGDGCLMEGVGQETIALAGVYKLNKLITLWDNNEICIDGPTDLVRIGNMKARFEAAGWSFIEVDGHNFQQIYDAIAKAKESADKPTLIACKTVIGKGSCNEGTEKTHGAPLSSGDLETLRKKLGYSESAPFTIEKETYELWQEHINARTAEKKHEWLKNVHAYNNLEFNDLIELNTKEHNSHIHVKEMVNKLKKDYTNKDVNLATRKLSEIVINEISKHNWHFIGGTADLEGSCFPRGACQDYITPENGYHGGFIRYGIREHAMGSVVNGLNLINGLIAYGSTFLVFADYLRSPLRVAALSHIPTKHIFTHDSIGVGEDGPTHQPVETLAGLRCIPNLLVFRPADIHEVAECWEIMLKQTRNPSVLVLSRQNVPTSRSYYSEDNLCAKGAYRIHSTRDLNVKINTEKVSENKHIVLVATGSEVSLAMQVSKLLLEKGIHSDVVSAPCIELFLSQEESYIDSVLNSKYIVGIEAGVQFGWERIIGRNGLFYGVNTFGISAPGKVAYQHFGLTADNISYDIEKKINSCE